MRGLVLALVVAVAATGCGGSTAKPRAGAASDPSSSTPSPTATGGAVDPSTSASPDAPAPDPGFGVPKTGQCATISAAGSRASVADGRRVSCRRAHTSVVAYVGYVPRPITAKTPLARRRALGNRLCAPAYRRLAGGTLADRATSLLTWTLFTPGQAQLQRGARWVRCDVLARSGDQLVPLPAGQPLLAQGVPEQLRVCQTDAGVDISCSRLHAYRVEAVFLAVGDTYPDPSHYTAVARERCKELMKGYGGYWQPPSRSGWAAGDRFIRCLSAGG